MAQVNLAVPGERPQVRNNAGHQSQPIRFSCSYINDENTAPCITVNFQRGVEEGEEAYFFVPDDISRVKDNSSIIKAVLAGGSVALASIAASMHKAIEPAAPLMRGALRAAKKGSEEASNKPKPSSSNTKIGGLKIVAALGVLGIGGVALYSGYRSKQASRSTASNYYERNIDQYNDAKRALESKDFQATLESLNQTPSVQQIDFRRTPVAFELFLSIQMIKAQAHFCNKNIQEALVSLNEAKRHIINFSEENNETPKLLKLASEIHGHLSVVHGATNNQTERFNSKLASLNFKKREFEQYEGDRLKDFKILNVTSHERKALKKAFRKLALQYFPDKVALFSNHQRYLELQGLANDLAQMINQSNANLKS